MNGIIGRNGYVILSSRMTVKSDKSSCIEMSLRANAEYVMGGLKQSQNANPHHLVFIADPQLVDPHTYPGRPWPLSTLTMRYTDMYMRKSFRRIKDVLVPDSVMFLGDLFDGGREWGNDPNDNVDTKELESMDREWRRYGHDYWLKEYRRFGRIFFDTWLRDQLPPRIGQRGRKFIASLPGNHDLGLGKGIRLPARKRFTAFFGDENRIDLIGNHSFVSLDTVSLSAKGQPNTDTGTQGMRDDEQTRAIWEPADQFLHEVKARKARVIDRELRIQNRRPENDPMDSSVRDLSDARSHTIEQQPYLDTDIPSIVLTHVPLYREPGTPCGPLREKYPPTRNPTEDGEYIEKDDANSIQVAAGKQYQNVLTPMVSNSIIDLVGDVNHVFSGDDHDYCELVHHEYTARGGGIREITVKSTSWAMGVRHPGFLLVSLWNPVDSNGKSINPNKAKTGTIQTHLCLLPDQLTIFIRYAILLIITLIILTGRAFRVIRNENIARKEDTSSHLPTIQPGSDIPLQTLSPASASIRPRSTTATTHSSSNSSSASDHQNHSSYNGSLNARSGAAVNRPRSISPGYNLPADEAKSLPALRREDWNNVDLNSVGNSTSARKGSRWRGEAGGLLAVWREVWRSVVIVGGFVGVWYGWLLWHS